MAVDHGAAEFQLAQHRFELVGGLVRILDPRCAKPEYGPAAFGFRRLENRSPRGQRALRCDVALDLDAGAGYGQHGTRQCPPGPSIAAAFAEVGSGAPEIGGGASGRCCDGRAANRSRARSQKMLLQRNFLHHRVSSIVSPQAGLTATADDGVYNDIQCMDTAQCYKRGKAWACLGRCCVVKKIRGVALEENLNNTMGLEFYNLSHRFRVPVPELAVFRRRQDRAQSIYMAKSGCYRSASTTSMQQTPHQDVAPAHVIQGTPFIDEVPLPHFFGCGIRGVDPKKKWEQITYDDLEKAAGKIVRPRDVVICQYGWHKLYEDSEDYFCRAPVSCRRPAMVFRRESQGGRPRYPGQRPPSPPRSARSATGRLHPHLAEEYKKWSGGRDWKGIFRNGSRCTASCSRTAFLASRMSAATSTRSPPACTFCVLSVDWDRGEAVSSVWWRLSTRGQLPDREGEKV